MSRINQDNAKLTCNKHHEQFLSGSQRFLLLFSYLPNLALDLNLT